MARAVASDPALEPTVNVEIREASSTDIEHA
jgi:hypothetical protein